MHGPLNVKVYSYLFSISDFHRALLQSLLLAG